MSKEGDKATVFRTTKVRTKLRDDGSWLQRRAEPEAETEKEEKPWLAEVRAGRVNGAPIETSPAPSPTKPTPAPIKPTPSARKPTPAPTNSETQKAPSGFIIRGVYTQPNKSESPTRAPSTNGPSSGTTQFTKKTSESYKKIAPYTVRPTLDGQESQLSPEEQEKRTEAASNVLKKSAGRQRSYVLSAAKKFESPAETAEALPDNNSTLAFVAKRVEITEDDDSAATPAPATSPPPNPINPITSVASAPQPKPRNLVSTTVTTAEDVTVNKPAAPKVEEKAAIPEPTKEEPAPISVPEKDPFEGMTPGCTKVATPLPELIPQLVEAVHKEPEPEDTNLSKKVETPLLDLTTASTTPASPPPAVPLSPTPASPISPPAVPLSPTPVSTTQAPSLPKWPPAVSPTPAPVVPLSPTQASSAPAPALPESPSPTSPTLLSPVPISPALVSAVSEITVKTEPEPEPEPEQKPEPSPKPSSSVDTLTTLSDTLISFNTSSTSLKDDEPQLEQEKGGLSDSHTSKDGDEEEPAPKISDCIPVTEDLLSLTDGPEAPAEPVPLSPGRWSQDLLSGLDSLSVQPEEEKPADETTKETQSSTETVTVTTKTVIITDKSEEDSVDPWHSRVKTSTITKSSSAEPFDPYPIGTTSLNRSSDLLQPLADISVNSSSTTFIEKKDPSPDKPMSSDALESLSDDVIPINTGATSLSTKRSWARSWETITTQSSNTEESQDTEPRVQEEDQNTVVMFERKSKENDSPWDRWTSPTVYTIPGQDDDDDEEEEESTEDTQTQTVTTITTIRHSEPEPVMDRYNTYTRTVVEEQRSQTPEPESKKGFVYLKEYVNATELSLHNARDMADGGSDYLTSRSANYSYSSPSSGSLSSTCNYCGRPVGNDAKISIEHLSINCHPSCFKCGVCDQPMGDLLHSMFLHDGKVHCENCYSRAFD